jgi:hypothetical protein
VETNGSFEGWAIVEMMGHRREIGYVTTEHYGAASLFRVDSPEFEEREFELDRPQYIGGRMVPIGSKVKRQAIPAKSCLVGPGSIYALNPCTEETARKAIERSIDRPLILLSVPERAQLASAEDIDADREDDFIDDDSDGANDEPEPYEDHS